MARKIYVVGAGGKTSLIRKMAQESVEKGLRVAILTTTHRMLPKEHGVLLDKAQISLEKEFEKYPCLEIGRTVKDRDGNLRMGYLGDEEYREIDSIVDEMLIEADGSKHLPVKVPASHEPVIFPDADVIYVVEGLSALGKPISMVCHRLELAKEILKVQDDKRILRIEDIGVLMQQGYLKPLRLRFPNAEVIPVFNQADTEELENSAKKLLEIMGEHGGMVVRLL